jgi:dipeptidase
MIPNWSTIKEIDTTSNNCMASPNYMQFAIDRGWYNPTQGEPFIWQKVYSPIPREWATARFWLFYSTYAPNLAKYPARKLKSPFDGMNPYVQYVEDLNLYPFSVKPENKISFKDIFSFFRSTFEGTIYDMTSDPDWYIPGPDGKMELSPLATPFPTRDMQKLLDLNWRRNVSRGGFGMVAQLRSWLPPSIGGIYWVYLDNQFVSPFVPIYAGVTRINPLYQNYNPSKYSDKSARWAYDFVDNLMYLKWQEAWKDVKPVRDSLENSTFTQMVELEKRALELHKKSPEKAKELLTDFVWNKMDQNVDAYIRLRYLLLTKYTNNKQGINF